jgi:hypothetical protein
MRRNLLEGPAFADEMDDQIKYTYRWLTTSCIVYSDNWDIVIREDADGHDYFFPPCHLLPFSRKDQGDINLTFKEDPKISEKVLKAFKEKVRECIQEGVELPQLDDLDRLELFGGTKMFDSTEGRTKTRTRGRLENPSLETTNEFKFKYAFVQKHAAEDRAAVIPDQKTLTTMRLLKKTLEAIRNCHSDTMRIKNWQFLPYFLSDLRSNYLMSDLKKCGLTFPRKLFYAVLEVCQEIYPKAEIFQKGIDGYKNSTILMPDGSTRLQTTGLNLGMMNEYVSFIMGCIVELWIDKQGFEDVSALMYNDDQIIRFANPGVLGYNVEERTELGESWDNFMIRHGLSVHDKKPFWSDRGCFLEVYGRPGKITYTLYKETQYIGNLYWSLLAYNIVEAKEFCSGVVGNLTEYYREKAKGPLSEIIHLWGYEFSPDEVKFSFPIGWVRETNDDGEYTLFDEIYKADILRGENHLTNIAPVPKPRRYNQSLKKLAGSFRDKYSWFISELTRVQSPEIVKRLSENLCPPNLGIRRHDVYQIYRDWKRNRYKAFKERFPLDPTEVIKRMIRENPDTHIPEEMFLRGRTLKDSGLDYPVFFVPDDEKISLREYIAFAKEYGMYKNFHVDTKLDASGIRKVANYFSLIHAGAEIGVSMLQTFDKAQVLRYLNLYSYGHAGIRERMFEGTGTWFPSFIPGRGYCILTPDYIKGPIRVSYENLTWANEAFGQYGPLVAYGLDYGVFSIEELTPLRDDFFYLIEYEIENMRIPEVEATSESKYYTPVESLTERIRRLFPGAGPPSSKYYTPTEGSTEEVQAERPRQRREFVPMTHLEYLQYQMAGVFERQIYMAAPEVRAQHFLDYGGSAQAAALEYDVFEDDMSEDETLGNMFGEGD